MEFNASPKASQEAGITKALTASSRKTRCRPGDMAFILHGLNTGKIVQVVRAHTRGEIICGSTWEHDATCQQWVIKSAGTPLHCVFASDGREANGLPVIVIGDRWLKPIRPGNGVDEALRAIGKPSKKSVNAERIRLAAPVV